MAASLGILAGVSCVEEDPNWDSDTGSEASTDPDMTATDPDTASGGDYAVDDGTTGTDTSCSEEVCNGVDDDCDGLIDEASASNDQCAGCRAVHFAERAYWFCEGPLTWMDAREACREFGAELAVIEDAPHNAFIAAEQPSNGGSFVDDMWIGLHDLDEEGEFVWVDGTALTFTAWDSGEPNDAGIEDCVEFYDRKPSVWNDAPCEDEQAYVCSAPHER